MEFHVLCLCAEWCHTCGDLEVENFPTIRVTRGEELLFHGPMEPLHAAAAATRLPYEVKRVAMVRWIVSAAARGSAA